MDFAKFAIEKRVISALMTLLILAGGYYSYTKLPRFEDPQFLVRQAKVITSYPGASAKQVAEEVTDVIEDAVQQLAGLKEVKSVSSYGVSEVSVEFKIASAKKRPALLQKFAQLRAKISDIQNRLPSGAGTPAVYDDVGDVYALYYAISGEGYSLPEIHSYAKKLKKQLVLVPGVSKVQLVGAPQEVIYVEYNPSKLVTLGLAVGQIAQVLDGQNTVSSAGNVIVGTQRITIRPTSALSSLKQIEDLIITDAKAGRTFRLRDIATVRKGLKEPAAKLLFRNGKPAIGLGVSNVIGGNVVNMGDTLNARIAELESQRPLGIDITAISDQSISVRASVDDFVVNVGLALAIVIATLLVFMGLSSGLLMGGILLVTVAGTLIGMYAWGINMHRISLGALIIALGMLVDNAIVVVEATLVKVNKGAKAADAVVEVVNQTKWPLLGGTVVGILAFSAIGFSPDNTGEFAGSLFWTMVVSLMFSWVVAIWLTPYYCTLMLKTPKVLITEEKENAVARGYRKVLELAVRKRWITVAIVVVMFVVALGNFSKVPAGFFPDSTRNQFVIDYNLPQGSAIEQTTRDFDEIDKWIRTLDGVTGTNAVIGGGHSRFMLTYGSESNNPAYGQILVDVESHLQIDGLLKKIQTHMDRKYLTATTKAWKFVLGPGGGSVIGVRFSGSDPKVLRGLADQAKSILTSAGAIAVKDDWNEMVKVIRPKINERNASRAGLNQSDISKAIAGFFEGEVIGAYREGETLSRIIFRPHDANRRDVKNIRNVQVFSSASGRYVPITQVVDNFNVVLENYKLRRYNRALAIEAKADPAPGIGAGDLFDEIKPKIETIELPAGYSLTWRGQYGNSQDANGGLASTIPFAFGAMVLVVILLFNAVRQPVIIYLIVPLALVGVVFGLVVTDTPLEFMAILGVFSLAGMLIKNAVVLIDQTDADILEGKARMSAVIDAAVGRMRPVVLGVLTTVLGVIPLLWDPFFKSLAVVIIFGLSFATILTLIVAPALYAIFFRIGNDEVESTEVEREITSG